MWRGGAGGETCEVEGEAGTEDHWIAVRERHRAPANVALNMPVSSGREERNKMVVTVICSLTTRWQPQLRKLTSFLKQERFWHIFVAHFSFLLKKLHRTKCFIFQINKETHTLLLTFTLFYASHRVVVLSSAEDHAAGRDLLL